MKNKITHAPIAYFCYNRPEHTFKSINALALSRYADQSDLYVFIDGPKNENDILLNKRVMQVVSNIQGFKSKTIIQNSQNKGLAKNITDGISTVIKEHGRVVVIEDDIVVSQNFLIYINQALDLYEKSSIVWHISGYNESIGLEDERRVFLQRNMRCWGWATWADRWKYFEKDPEIILTKFSKKDIYRFNLDGSDNLFSQIVANHRKEIDTWAIFWYATIFRNNGLCLNPIVSLVNNIGFDGTGTHCGYDNGKHLVKKLNCSDTFDFSIELVEDEEIFKIIKTYFQNYNNKSVIKRLFNYIKNHLHK